MIDDMLVQARFDDLDRVLDMGYAARKARAILATSEAAPQCHGFLSWLGISAPMQSRAPLDRTNAPQNRHQGPQTSSEGVPRGICGGFVRGQAPGPMTQKSPA